MTFDAGYNNQPGGGGTWTHVNSGNILVAGIVGGFNSDNVTGVKYNGVSMTQQIKVAPFGNSTRYVYLYTLVNPSIGSSSIITSISGSDIQGCCSASYFGASAVNQPDNTTSNTNGGSSTNSLTTSITTNNPGCWVINFSWCFGGQLSAGTGATGRVTTATNNIPGLFDSNGPVNPAGSYSMTINSTVSNSFESLEISILPAVAGGAFLYNFM
jgi:hypothetical protein